MPTPYIQKLASDLNVDISQVEELWNRAKDIARSKFEESDDQYFPYVTGILKNMLGVSNYSFASLSSKFWDLLTREQQEDYLKRHANSTKKVNAPPNRPHTLRLPTQQGSVPNAPAQAPNNPPPAQPPTPSSTPPKLNVKALPEKIAGVVNRQFHFGLHKLRHNLWRMPKIQAKLAMQGVAKFSQGQKMNEHEQKALKKTAKVAAIALVGGLVALAFFGPLASLTGPIADEYLKFRKMRLDEGDSDAEKRMKEQQEALTSDSEEEALGDFLKDMHAWITSYDPKELASYLKHEYNLNGDVATLKD